MGEMKPSAFEGDPTALSFDGILPGSPAARQKGMEMRDDDENEDDVQELKPRLPCKSNGQNEI